MELSGGRTSEKISGATFTVAGVHSPENVAGAKGNALRLDGYSTYIDARIGNAVPAGSKKMTASIWFAVETYPVVEIDVNTAEQVAIASCIDETAKTGFGFFIGFDGKYSFKTYLGGWPLEIKVNTPLKRYEWINLTAVIDTESRTAILYNNGEEVAKSKANGTLTVANSTMRIGRSFNERFSGPFCLTSFCGIIDDITVWDEALPASTIAGWSADNDVDMTIPESRFADDPMRPTFHGMPGANWTNETHGMTYSNGRYHVFFQKNANGPYMTRLHWGHLSSDNLYNWREEPIAIAPGESFDIKGCWSGCVFTDDVITGGRPSAIYTAVDYAKAVIAQANPVDDDLIGWEKASAPIINGRPSGLSDDFRDPYFFRNGENAYIIVGSSKNGVGTTTLHSYNAASRTWSNDGMTFFTGSDKASCGTFWEMPNITRIGDKWVFTTTPLNTSKGVKTIYWTGDINADGTFRPDKSAPTDLELSGFARDGYGLLSPTVYNHDGKTIVLGIVPDKLPSQINYDLGYAHTYSLPREWYIGDDGTLCQRPYSGLTAMRGSESFTKSNFTLNGAIDLNPVEGRQVELSGVFTAGNGKCGFTLLDDGNDALKVYYDGPTNEVVVDARSLQRLSNDSGSFDGYYHSVLPQPIAKGSDINLHVYYDHSVIDLFVNDKWAAAVRVFPQAKSTEKATMFADGETAVKNVGAWNLDAANNSSVDEIVIGSDEAELSAADGGIRYANVTLPATLSVYNIAGSRLLETPLTATEGTLRTPFHGFHIVVLSTPSGPLSRKLAL